MRISKDHILHLYAEMVETCCGKMVKSAAFYSLNVPILRLLDNIAAQGFCDILTRNVFLRWSSKEHWFLFGNGTLEAQRTY